ncbi:MAG TPA: cytochrome c oxidase assembly protein [Casimicrobiaceae bacterium]|nr:cytochrome c oxidase assembly protein [Casimicrobiaceae bacterium]
MTGVVAFADSASEDSAAIWHTWNFTPFISVMTVFVLWIYLRGRSKAGIGQRVLFLAGTAIMFLALQSPLDGLADVSFAAHQIQHISIHAFGPMLIALSAPAGAMLAGMPASLLRGIYVPIARVGAIRGLFSVLSRPIVASVHFSIALVFWLIPSIQARALGDSAFHDLMHFSMMAAGLFFWFSMFDPRSPPTGSRYSVRVFALLGSLLVNVGFGAWLAMKSTIMWPAYGTGLRVGMTPLFDERLGGTIQYVPGNMMMAIGVIIVIAAWYRRERRTEGWQRRAIERQASARVGVQELRQRNRRVVASLLAVGAFMFTAAIVVGFLDHLRIH